MNEKCKERKLKKLFTFCSFVVCCWFGDTDSSARPQWPPAMPPGLF